MQNYFGGYTPYAQNMYQPMPQYQMPQQQMVQQPQPTMMQAPNYVLGKTVNSAADIMAVDVPMGAQKVFFPQADGKVLYARSWGGDGLIKPETYILQEPEAAKQTEPVNELDKIYEKLALIEEKLNKWEA